MDLTVDCFILATYRYSQMGKPNARYADLYQTMPLPQYLGILINWLPPVTKISNDLERVSQ